MGTKRVIVDETDDETRVVGAGKEGGRFKRASLRCPGRESSHQEGKPCT